MTTQVQCIRSFFQTFGAEYNNSQSTLENYKSYLMFDCNITSTHAEFVCSIIPSKDIECRINGAFFLTIFSPASSINTTNGHKDFGFQTSVCFANVGTADKLALKSNYKTNTLVADYINRHSGEREASYEWNFAFEAGLHGLALSGTNFDFWVESAHPTSAIKALRREWDTFFK